MFRDLTPIERARALDQTATRTQFENKAFLLLPRSLRAQVKRNPPIAFPDEKKAFYPDLYLPDYKICIEIDGGYHNTKKQRSKDEKRDLIFKNHDFTVIHIVNKDTMIDVAFWQRLQEGLEMIDNKSTDIVLLIEELKRMINKEIRSWTDIY